MWFAIVEEHLFVDERGEWRMDGDDILLDILNFRLLICLPKESFKGLFW